MKMDITNGLNNCKVYAYLHGRKKLVYTNSMENCEKYCEERNYKFMDNDGNLWQLQIDDSELYEE
jgi:hypothetical protein